MTRYERILEVLQGLGEDDTIEMWNEYQERNNYEDRIYYMSEVDEVVFCDRKMTLEEVQWLYDNNFYPEDEYFTYDGYDIKTFSDIYEIADDSTLADYIDDNEEDFGNSDLMDIFEEEEEEEEE